MSSTRFRILLGNQSTPAGSFGCSLAETLSEPIGYELPRLVRVVGLDMLGATLSQSENSQLF